MKINDKQWNELIKLRDNAVNKLEKESIFNRTPIMRIINMVHDFDTKGRDKYCYDDLVTFINKTACN